MDADALAKRPWLFTGLCAVFAGGAGAVGAVASASCSALAQSTIGFGSGLLGLVLLAVVVRGVYWVHAPVKQRDAALQEATAVHEQLEQSKRPKAVRDELQQVWLEARDVQVSLAGTISSIERKAAFEGREVSESEMTARPQIRVWVKQQLQDFEKRAVPLLEELKSNHAARQFRLDEDELGTTYHHLLDAVEKRVALLGSAL